MEEGSNNTIRVRSKYANQLKSLANTDKILSTVKLHEVENADDDEVYFRIKFNDDNSSYGILELQVRISY